MNRKPCPIPSHRNSTTCCGRGELPERGRKATPRWKYVGPGIRQYPDGHIERTPAAMGRHKDKLLRRGDVCSACGEGFTNQFEVELSHRHPKGFAGWKRDDSDDNLVLLHKRANGIQGSMPLETFLANWKPAHCKGE
jgi:hypothetical protein